MMATTTLYQPAAGAATRWRIDPAASWAEFQIGKRFALVRRLTVTGKFTEIAGKIALDAASPSEARVELTIGAASVSTGHPRRDGHLRAADFFDVERCPHLTFSSRAVDVVDAAAGLYRVVGDLTVRGTTREVVLDVRCSLPGPSERRPVVRAIATGVLNRHDFGLTWGNPLIRVADEARISVSIEAIPAPTAGA
jgi:polyisoprenoid-binding protein YceI